MLLGNQIYSRPLNKKQKHIRVNIDLDQRHGYVLNLTGFCWVDAKYGFVRSMLEKQFGEVILTDSDLIARDDYTERLNKKSIVIFVYRQGPRCAGFHSNVAFNGNGASEKRIKSAIEKLKGMGIKTKFFRSERTCLNYISKLKGT